MRYLLFQCRRPEDPVRDDEHRAFAARLEVDPAVIATVDLLTVAPDLSLLDGCDAVFVGGAGEFSLLDDIPEIRRFVDFLASLTEAAIPIFASCFGFQALVLGLGGEIVHDPAHAEVGSYVLELTEAGLADPLFGDLPREFIAQLGHQDRASRLPSGVVNLARSERTPYQAIRVGDGPVYATQFHPELTWLDNRSRFERYMKQYSHLFGQKGAKQRLDSHLPSPEANALLPKFVRMFVE